MVYWRLANIPELQGLDASARRDLWREAVTRSPNVPAAIALIGLCVAGGTLCFLATTIFPSLLRGWPHYVTVAIVNAVILVANDLCFTKPWARRWLRANPQGVLRAA
ncbi:hypothetical protein [Dyella sp. 20L07]|uniref:hypothetical protein n=1 Tax=Dyella sp. 20L07 TaxID=3384240 RepID=UPI003D28FF4C